MEHKNINIMIVENRCISDIINYKWKLYYYIIIYYYN